MHREQSPALPGGGIGPKTFIYMISPVRYHCGGSMELNARILLLAYMVYL
jgi:hypothetical protein